MHMDDKMTIKLNLAGKEYPLRIEREEEQNMRLAAKLLESKLSQYQGHFDDNKLDVKDFLSFVALQFAYEYVKLNEDKSIEPLLEKIQELNTDLESFLR
jgi:Cell division protein ZapA.